MYLPTRPKKSLGQNFLIDKNIIKKIINIASDQNIKNILEIGSGRGNLTEELYYLNPKNIYAIEKDKNLAEILKKKFMGSKNIKIINQDIFDVLKKNKFEKNTIVFGNLPYNISTQILASLISTKKWPPWYSVLILMFQKEVADRILGKSSTKDFGRLAILSNWRLNIKKHFNISKNCFFPKPKIESTVLSFRPKKDILKIKNISSIETVTRILFSSRRKIIKNNFLKLFNGNKSIANKLNLTLNERAEQLDKEVFYKIASEYEKLVN
jgi:16S rRNA (adenine1518-N6/adenine1519-N6)-dimethyltransferase